MYRLRHSGPAAHRLRCLGAGLVCLALLLQALALFQGACRFAARLSDVDAGIEICTPAGILRISPQKDGSDAPRLLSIEACPYSAVVQFFPLPGPGELPGRLAELRLSPIAAGIPRQLPAPDQRHAPPRGPPPGA